MIIQTFKTSFDIFRGTMKILSQKIH